MRATSPHVPISVTSRPCRTRTLWVRSRPFGARGVGEPPIVPAPACIANAIQDAAGVRMTECPITPEKIALAIAAGNGR